MLKKLIKHEWLATWKNLAMLNGGILLLGILGRIILPLLSNSNLFKINLFAILISLCGVFYIFAIFAVAIITNVLLISRFYRNMFTDEGYLMHTLPVTSSAHILSKLVVYIAWFVIDGISILASLSILFSVNMNWLTFFSSLWDAFVSLGEVLRAPAPLVLLYALVLALAMTASGVLSIYFSASVGSLFNTHKKLGGICCFVGISMALQFISAFALLTFNWSRIEIVTETSQAGFGTVEYVSYIAHAWPVMFMILAFYLLLDLLFFLGTQHILSRKLNLE